MKTILTVILLMLSANVFALERCHVGAWNDLDRVGEGIAFEVNPQTDEVNGFFYTYNKTKPTWFLLLGAPDDITMYDGRKSSESPFKAKVAPVGKAKVLSVSDDILVFAFNLDINFDGQPCFGNCGGEYVYHRITQMIDCPE